MTQTPRSPLSFGVLPIIAPAARRSALIVPSRLTLITVANASSGVGPSRPISLPGVPRPAQVTEIRRPPGARPAARSTAACTEGPSVTSQVADCPPICAATSLGSLRVEVRHNHVGALLREPAGGRLAESRCAAEHDCCGPLDLHVTPVCSCTGDGIAAQAVLLAAPATRPWSWSLPISFWLSPRTSASTSSVCSPRIGARRTGRRPSVAKSSGERGAR